MAATGPALDLVRNSGDSYLCRKSSTRFSSFASTRKQIQSRAACWLMLLPTAKCTSPWPLTRSLCQGTLRWLDFVAGSPPLPPPRNMPHIALAACSSFPFHQRTEQSVPLSRNTGLGLMPMAARAGLAFSKHNASLSQCKRKARRDDDGETSSTPERDIRCTNLFIFRYPRKRPASDASLCSGLRS